MKSYFQSGKAMGTHIELCLVAINQYQTDELFKILWQEISDFEKRFSRFLGSSELSSFNHMDGKKVKISGDFKDMLVASKQLSKSTGGLFNPFILPALQHLGYKYSLQGTPIDPITDYSDRGIGKIGDLKIGDDWAKIPSNTALDLGGIAKGYLADKLTQIMPSSLPGYWLSIGGDLVAGGTDENGNPWDISIQSASDTNLDIATYQHPDNTHFAIATSGIAKRSGIKKGKSWHHIIDPRTLESSDSDITMASVITRNATEADVLASCAVIAGSKEAVKTLKKHTPLACLLQSNSSPLTVIGSGIRLQSKVQGMHA